MNAAAEPFAVTFEDGVLQLTLDTPACSHNIFSRDAAAQLCRILEEADRDRVSLVLIRSGKSASFINGVGLLMAGTARRPQDIPVMTGSVKRAYRALRDFPAPSVAIIAGNCYGCGVEFALHCDYRLACESQETHFYMTEIADYLFIPAFGATQDLPRVLGLEAATDFLVWGERWTARQAAERGLIDASFEAAEFEEGVKRFVRDLTAAPRKRPIVSREVWGARQDAHVLRTRERIGKLPPHYQSVYEQAYDLMLRAARAENVTENDYAAELRACGESVVQPHAKASVSLFFVRQLATHHCLRGYELPAVTRFVFDEGEERLSSWRRELLERRVRGLQIATAADESTGALVPADAVMELGPVREDGTLRPGTVGAILEPRVRPERMTAAYCVYSPFPQLLSRLIEVACVDPRAPLARTVFAVLDRAGYCPVLSRPERDFATNALLVHYLAPLVAFVARDGRARDAHRSLREFGFVRPLAPLLKAVPSEQLCHWMEPLLPDVDDSAIRAAIVELASTTDERGIAQADVLDAMLLSLGVFAAQAVATRVVGHPALIDVMARELIDFPLGHGSLCRFLSPRELARLHGRAASLGAFFSREFMARAARLGAREVRFYSAGGEESKPVAFAGGAQREARA